MQNGVHRPINEHVFGHVVLRKLEVWVAEKVPDVAGISGQQIIETENLVAPPEEAVAEMASQKTRASSHNRSHRTAAHCLPIP